MEFFIYYHPNEKNVAEENAQCLRENGNLVFTIESEMQTVGCQGCEHAPECEDFDFDDGCVVSPDNTYRKYEEVIEEEDDEGPDEYIRTDGVYMVKFPEHPYADTEGFVEWKRCVLEWLINAEYIRNNNIPNKNYFTFDSENNTYLIRPDCEVKMKDGDENNLEVENLTIKRLSEPNVKVAHPGSEAVQ